jgi:hypothetical protein
VVTAFSTISAARVTPPELCIEILVITGLQPLGSKNVPESDAERMVEILREKGLLVAYVPFDGEQYGCQCTETIRQTLDGEFSFYS